MRTRLTSRLYLLFVSFALMLALPAIAFADNTVADGDGLTPVANQNMAVGDVACDVASNKDARIAITRQGAAGSTNVFANGSTATVTVQSVTGAGLSAQVGASNTITLPSNWSTQTNGTLSNSVLSTVTVDSSVEGAGSGSVTYVATGKNAVGSGSTITRTDVMDVTWTTGSCTPADTTAPVITKVVTPGTPDGDNGWYKSNVTVDWTVSDPESPNFQTTGCVDQSITADQAATTYSCSATSAGGSAAEQSVTIKRDATAPTISGAASPAANTNGWNNGAVTVSYTCSDATSGVASCGPDETLSNEGANQSSTGNATDNAGNTASDTVSNIDIDLTDPLVALDGGPADGSSPYFGSVPNAPTCTASDALSGLAGPCTVSGYGTTVGSHTVTASATDNADNNATASRTYSVLAWTLNGFKSPVDMGIYNDAKGGSTVPLKFEVFAGPTELTSTNVVDYFTQKISCASGVGDAIEQYSTGNTELRYDTTSGQFIFNWKTPKAPGSCYRVTLQTDDGSQIYADFRLK